MPLHRWCILISIKYGTPGNFKEKMIRELYLENALQSRMVFSKLNTYSGTHAQQSFFSIKYVHSGTETYEMNGKIFPVKDRQYLLTGCQSSTYEVYIQSNEEVKGMCLFIPATLVMDVYENMIQKQDFLLDYPAEKLSPLQIRENIFCETENATGHLLQALYNSVDTETYISVDSSVFFYSVCESILINTREVIKEQQPARIMKKSTAKELVRRLLMAKTKLDQEPDKLWSMEELAGAVHLSEYHFFRSFKKMFNITPYQYLMEKRIQLASSLLLENKYMINEIAVNTGFADIYSFSKYFKKRMGMSPCYFRQGNNHSSKRPGY